MNEIIFIKNQNEISLQNGWVNQTLTGRAEIFTEQKEYLTDQNWAAYQGKKYRIVAKHVIYYTFCERISRIFQAFKNIVISCGTALRSDASGSEIYKLLFDKFKSVKSYAKRYEYNDYRR